MCQNVLQYVSDYIDRVERHIRSTTQREIHIHVGFCANDDINAFAAKVSPETYLIGINTGAITMLLQIYHAIYFEFPKLCSQINLDQFPGIVDKKFARAQPLSMLSILAALHFLISHEIGHIVYGHTDLLRDKFNVIDEIYLLEATHETRHPLISSFLFQAMETEADFFGNSSVVLAIGKKGTLCGVCFDNYLSRRELYRISSIAILIMFHAFYGTDVNLHLSDYTVGSHPVPELRLFEFWDRTELIQKDLPSKLTEGDFTQWALEEVVDCLSEEWGRSLFPVLMTNGRKLIAEIARLRDNKERLSKELSNYRLLPNGGVVF